MNLRDASSFNHVSFVVGYFQIFGMVEHFLIPGCDKHFRKTPKVFQTNPTASRIPQNCSVSPPGIHTLVWLLVISVQEAPPSPKTCFRGKAGVPRSYKICKFQEILS